MNAQREITKLKRENERLQKQIKLLAIGLDCVFVQIARVVERTTLEAITEIGKWKGKCTKKSK